MEQLLSFRGYITCSCLTAVRIDDAAWSRWEWNAYGNTSGRRYCQQYVRKGNVIDATTDVDWYVPRLLPSTAEPAVVIL